MANTKISSYLTRI